MSSQVAIVTGASSGLGRSLAGELATSGYTLGLIARRREHLQKLATELHSAGHRAEFATADVGSRVRMQEAVRELSEKLGPVELAIANAGIGLRDQLDPFDSRVVEQVMRVNFLGSIHLIEAVLPKMLEQRRGHIVGISSLGADRGLPGSSAYTASKAALNTYFDGLRVALRPSGIAVTTVCPGFVRTGMVEGQNHPMPWILEPEDAARRVVRALRRKPGRYRFPLPMSFLMRFLRLVPDRLMGHVLSDRVVVSGADPAHTQSQ